MAKLMCAKCGGKVKMANGGTTPKKVLAKAPVNMYGIPQENMGTSSQYGFGRKGGTVKKMQDGGIFTPNGRLKSKKTRNVDTGFNPNSSVSRTKRNGDVVTKSITTSQGFVPSASKTKTITDKEGAIKSEKTKGIGWNSALRKINRVDKNAGRNENDTYTYKKGGSTKATKFAALAPPYNKATFADRIVGAKMTKKRMGGVTKKK
jgi:hypothetical protein